MKAGRVRFTAVVELTDSVPPWHILRVPREKVADFGFTGNLRRVVCTLSPAEPFHCALFPSKGDFFLTLNQKLRSKLGLSVGDSIVVELQKDESKYGMPMPEEFAEVLRQDPDAARLFDALSPGDQRLMLKLVVFVKDPDRRIGRALAGVELLKASGGTFDYAAQHFAMRLTSQRR